MKAPHSFLLLTIFALLAGGCASESGVTVGSDQRGQATDMAGNGVIDNTTDGVDFTKYKTYSWASQVSNSQNGSLFLNDLLFKGMIRDAVEHEMASRGYTYQPTGGDLVMNFRSFDQPTEITSTSSLGAGYWDTSESYAFNDKQKVKLDRGSILVQMIDRKKGEAVWQGYASGLTDGDVFNKDKDKVYVAVGQIFKEYNHRADKL
ncbi:DUF4136 domain-containing protein [Hymenobacter sp. UV11]|uniref:DUF4136 domain-containing protein n=1 Tax=Hymenobacter sp. UV11 TaxID=1849735 RepID=UPI00105E4BCD|nr:DUF4136 domain-containing protein [Hymenobacter sp. UV11]TDN40320.1 hypothetical protein A8B98_12800 [Hymenobacter sp. UV11]TFZ66680.1 DUF4136 domain-containing protein [Hymenobacter sp. UV11]